MVKLPISETALKYYEEIGYKFSFKEQAHLCWTYNSLLKDRLESLKEILAVSDDEKLNMEIRQRIEYEEKAYGHFVTNQNPGCIYVVHPNDENEYDDGYFASALSAISYGNRNCAEGYRIIKRYLSDQCPKEMLGGGEPNRYNTQLSVYDFTANGMIEYGYSYECPAQFDEEDKARFEDMFLNIKSPFGLGDIVMGERFERPGVVSSDHDCFEKIYRKHEKDTEICIDDTDNCIRADFMGKDGRLTYDHIAPFTLWKTDSWGIKSIGMFCSLWAIKQGVDLINFDYFLYEYSKKQ